jgi:hypothetical protein
MSKFSLPQKYSELSYKAKRLVREQYIEEQNNKCMYCHYLLTMDPPKEITDKDINWKLFPPNFLKYPIHLQHDHSTDLTEGSVHSYCNAVLWQYHGR